MITCITYRNLIRSDPILIRSDQDLIRSNPLEVDAGGLGVYRRRSSRWVRRSDGATEGRWSSAIGVGLARAGWHDLGERESEQRRGVAGGDRLGVAGGDRLGVAGGDRLGVAGGGGVVKRADS
uniref:Uncharacterized protein n=1 Tax=Fagus sylvatica TaxID=28930 RepID=A0A2N9HUB5_FAGSY